MRGMPRGYIQRLNLSIIMVAVPIFVYFSAKIGIQLSKLGSALAATRKKTEIGREELKALLRIGKDTIPKEAKVLQRDLELEKRKQKIKK